MVGDKCPLTSAVSINCHFDLGKSMEHMSTYFFGVYDYVLGYFARLSSMPVVKQCDELNMKINAEKVIGDDILKVYSLTQYINNVILKIEHFTSLEHYY